MSPRRCAPTTPAGRAAACALLLVAGAATAQSTTPLPAGSYAGELCVATGDAAADCGPAQVTLQSRGRVQVRIADIVYRLQLHSSQLDMVLMHGTMQIDGFTATYEWQDRSLVFRDPDKAVAYRVRVGPAAR